MFTVLRRLFLQFTGTSNQPDIGSKSTSPVPYSDAFSDAMEFSRSQGLKLDSNPSEVTCEILAAKAAQEIANGLYDQIDNYRKIGCNPYMAIGGDCGNVHLLIANFLLKEYPKLSPNLVMGSVALNQKESFNFSEEKFIDWRQRGYGDVFDCHAWVSLGQNWIIDATICTWMHTRRGPGGAFGGILYGSPSSLKCVPITNEKHVEQSLTGIRYRPVVLGVDAFSLVHQARARSRRNGV